MQNYTQITQEQYDYALNCLPPIYASKFWKEYLTNCIEYDMDVAFWTITITWVFQNSEPTKHELFYNGKDKPHIYKPVYATYFIYDGKYYQSNHDFQNLYSISF